jgi:hypothetical protein
MRLMAGMFGFAVCMTLAMTVSTPADAGDSPERSFPARAPLEIEHTLNLEFAQKSRKRDRKPQALEIPDFLDPEPKLEPFTWPRNSDMRARLLTPELQRTPIFGWLAANLYRSRGDNGWCLEVDPGEGEYLVFYRLNL